MTAGERGGWDYGRDHQTYPTYPDAGQSGAGGYGAWSGGHHRYDSEPYGYPAADYPPGNYPPGSYQGGGYPTETYPPPYPPRSPDPWGSDPRGGDWQPPAGRPGPGNGRAAGNGRVSPRAATASGRRTRRGLPLWQELPLLLIIAFCLAVLVRTFLLQAFFIPSGSMEDTLLAGDRVLVNKVVYNFREPARGEVVVFKGTDAWAPVGIGDEDIGTFAKVGRTLGDLVGISRPGEKDYIKRVIGVPGDTVSCCDVDGRVFVNGQPLDEDYVIRDSPLDESPPSGAHDCRSRRFEEVVVQPGQMFVMGDHRQVSQDSRCQGQVPIENVIGRAFLIVWPSGRWDSLAAPETFDGVPAAAAGHPVAPSAPAQLAVVLPLLLPIGWTFRGGSARSRLIGRGSGRRLAEW